MEVRGQEKGSIRMPSSLASSVTSALGERRGDHSSIDHHIYQHHQQLNLQHRTQKPARENIVPDPAPAPAPAPITATTSAMNTAASTPSRSVSRSPPTTTTSTASSTRYHECLKNHAASMGGHVVDGCGEFMPSGEDGTLEALKCAACECHRNFHRKEIDGELQPQYAAAANNHHYKINCSQRINTLPPPPQQIANASLPPPQQQQLPFHQHHGYPHHGLSMSISTVPIAPMMMTFGGVGATESSSEDLNMLQSNLQGQTSMQTPSSKKRFRTKFSQEQKEKMMEFAEKIGWKIQKQDEQEVQQFCSQTGVKRKVFKVWMHNNKQAMKKI